MGIERKGIELDPLQNYGQQCLGWDFAFQVLHTKLNCICNVRKFAVCGKVS